MDVVPLLWRMAMQNQRVNFLPLPCCHHFSPNNEISSYDKEISWICLFILIIFFSEESEENSAEEEDDEEEGGEGEGEAEAEADEGEKDAEKGDAEAGPSGENGVEKDNESIGSNEAGPSSSKESTDQVAQAQEEEDDPSNLQLAWEMLELAKTIFSKHADSLEAKDEKRLALEDKLSETYQTLGEVSIGKYQWHVF